MKRLTAAVAALAGVWGTPAEAQRTEENTTREAEDGFGKSVGSESIGIYASGEVRGFSATDAGNNRIEGLYWDRQATITSVIQRGSTVRLGLAAFGYPLPAPTGIVDYDLRRTGKDRVVSVQLNSGDYLGTDLVVDAALPVTETLSVNADFGLYDDEYVNGTGGWYVSYGGVARWRPARTVELTGIFGRYDYGDEEQGPVIFPAGAALPRRVERRLYWGQDWADWAGHAQNGGLIAKASLGKWQIAAGAFQSRFTRDTYHAAYYRDVDARGIGRSVMVAGQDQVAESWSGEIRVSRSFDEGRRRHLLLGSLRGRDVRVGYGGYATVELGTAPIGVSDPQPQPAFAFGPRSRDQVRQTSAAVGYELRWAGLGELNLGLTRSDYRKTIRVPGAVPAGQHDQPWLWNAALAITATARLTLYGAATRGLEESGVAPANAENRGQALPALRTRQMEAGLRYALPGGWRLNAAAFEIAKPYFDIDRSDGAYRQLGDVTHRGIEGSLSGAPFSGMSLVAGAVWLRPRVSGQAVADGRLGAKPIGRTSLLVDASADYRVAALPGFSVDGRVTVEGERVANAANTLSLPARAVIDLGARYRTRVARTPVLVRAQIRNVTDNFAWKVSSGGGFTLQPGRRATLSLTADF